MVRMLRPCFRANISRSGMRAIVPSSFMISQMTPAGVSPARRARSTDPLGLPRSHEDASVARAEREDVARRDQILGRVVGIAARRVVCARSAALMPVVTPVRASMLTVNAVPSAGPRAPRSASSAG